MSTQTRRRIGRHAATVLTCVLMIGGLVAVTLRFGESLWALTDPPDRLPSVIVDAESLRAIRGAPDSVAAPLRAPAPADSTSLVRARGLAGGGVGEVKPEPVVRVGARAVVPDTAPTEAQSDAEIAAAPGEPAFTMEVEKGRAIYRMNGELVVDPEHQREEQPVEVGFEYRFGKRGLEKVKLWEVRR